jgi:putative transposase
MPRRLRRYYGSGYAHFITTSCYRRLPLLSTARRRTLLLKVLEQVRRQYGFVVFGYVIMPEHIHLLIGEPERSDPSTVMQALKQGWARRVAGESRRHTRGQAELWPEMGHLWQRRFYDFVVWSRVKREQKLRYMHENPVKRGLVLEAGQWRWSSLRFYAYGEPGTVLVNEQRRAEMGIKTPLESCAPHPTKTA